jgi:hypothetical protein
MDTKVIVFISIRSLLRLLGLFFFKYRHGYLERVLKLDLTPCFITNRLFYN